MSKPKITITLHPCPGSTTSDLGCYPDDVEALVSIDGRPVGREHIALDHAHGEVLRLLVDHARLLMRECDRRERRTGHRLATHDLPSLYDVGADLAELDNLTD